MTSVKVGNVEIISLLDMSFAFPLAGAFPSIEADAWAPYRNLYPEMFGSGEEFATNAQCYALRSGDRTILVDTGMGTQGPAGQAGNLLPDMRSKGIDPESVDTVVFTHHHFDHDADFPAFILTRWDQMVPRDKELHVYGPTLTEEFTNGIIDEDIGLFRHDWKARVGHVGSQITYRDRGGELPRSKPLVIPKDVGPGVIV